MKLLLHHSLLAILWLATFTPLLPAADPAPEPKPDDETYVLPKLEVGTKLVCSFGFGLMASWDPKTQRVGRIFITEVNANSTAERLGLKRGDEILAINGKKVADLKGGNKPGSDLFALLVNRPAGELIDLEVAVRVVKNLTLPAAQLGAPPPLKPAAELKAQPASN
jgi:membrane-associated protease RseP (regulator of RpoE activity)